MIISKLTMENKSETKDRISSKVQKFIKKTLIKISVLTWLLFSVY